MEKGGCFSQEIPIFYVNPISNSVLFVHHQVFIFLAIDSIYGSRKHKIIVNMTLKLSYETWIYVAGCIIFSYSQKCIDDTKTLSTWP